MRRQLIQGLGVTGVAVLLATGLVWMGSGVAAQVSIDGDDIGGVRAQRERPGGRGLGYRRDG